jgi:hypothetical protein
MSERISDRLVLNEDLAEQQAAGEGSVLQFGFYTCAARFTDEPVDGVLVHIVEVLAAASVLPAAVHRCAAECVVASGVRSSITVRRPVITSSGKHKTHHESKRSCCIADRRLHNAPT